MAIISRLVFVAVVMFAMPATFSQTRAVERSKHAKAGELVPLGEAMSVKVTRSTKSPFASVKVKGEPVVVLLELDAGKNRVMFSYNISADAKSSDLVLASGTHNLAPRAVVEDFPSLGKDNDKEIELLDPKDSVGSVSLTFEGKGVISLLFDVPADQAKTPKKLSLTMRTLQPKAEQSSLIVDM